MNKNKLLFVAESSLTCAAFRCFRLHHIRDMKQLSAWTVQILPFILLIFQEVKSLPRYPLHSTIIKGATTPASFALSRRRSRIDRRRNVCISRRVQRKFFPEIYSEKDSCQQSHLSQENDAEKGVSFQCHDDDLPFLGIRNPVLKRSSFLHAYSFAWYMAGFATSSTAAITLSMDQEEDLPLKRPTKDQPQILFPDASMMSRRPMDTALEGTFTVIFLF